MNVVLVDYGMGNLGSVRRAFEECGATVLVATDPAQLGTADRIVLPGVGAFSEGMANLNAAGWPVAIRAAVQNPRVALLGLCLGMHLLADKGHEGGENAGLGLVPGEVRRLEPVNGERVPHVGWNEVVAREGSRLFRRIGERLDFYFVHSFRLCAVDRRHVAATTPYCGEIVSAVEADNVFGVQFHPEKSSRAGFALIRNFLTTC